MPSKKDFLFGMIMSMKTSSTTSLVLKSHIVRIVLGTVGVLLMPLLAMQFTDEVNWSVADFITIGVLLFGTGLLCELITRKVRDKKSRLVLGILLF